MKFQLCLCPCLLLKVLVIIPHKLTKYFNIVIHFDKINAVVMKQQATPNEKLHIFQTGCIAEQVNQLQSSSGSSIH
jgi:hypothetical protein